MVAAAKATKAAEAQAAIEADELREDTLRAAAGGGKGGAGGEAGAAIVPGLPLLLPPAAAEDEVAALVQQEVRRMHPHPCLMHAQPVRSHPCSREASLSRGGGGARVHSHPPPRARIHR